MLRIDFKLHELKHNTLNDFAVAFLSRFSSLLLCLIRHKWQQTQPINPFPTDNTWGWADVSFQQLMICSLRVSGLFWKPAVGFALSQCHSSPNHMLTRQLNVKQDKLWLGPSVPLFVQTLSISRRREISLLLSEETSAGPLTRPPLSSRLLSCDSSDNNQHKVRVKWSQGYFSGGVWRLHDWLPVVWAYLAC